MTASGLLPLILLVATARGEQVVRVEVASPTAVPGLAIEARTTWLGEERRLALVDDGSAPGDVPGDGLYVGEWRGEPVRILPVTLELRTDGLAPFDAYSALEQIAVAEDRLAYAVDLDATPAIRRLAAPLLGRPADAREVNGIAASLGWACLVLIYVAWLVERLLARGRR